MKKEKITSITEYKNSQEEKRKKEYMNRMAKIIAASEKNLKVISS